MADGTFSQIVGADGRFMDPDEARLAILVEGVENGSLNSPEVYTVGASLLSGLGARLPTSPTVTRARNVFSPQVLRAMTSRATAPMSSPGLTALQNALGPSVQSVQAGEVREVVQGLDSGAVLIAAGATAILTFNASMLFRPTRLMIGPTVAPNWVIEDIKVAADSLFLQTGPVPGEVYLPNGVGASALKRRTAQPGTPVQVTVTNIDVAPHRFRGAMFGAAADASSCAPSQGITVVNL